MSVDIIFYNEINAMMTVLQLMFSFIDRHLHKLSNSFTKFNV